MSQQSANNLLLLFDRPIEPICMPKGERKVVFEIPPEYLPEKYQPIAQNIFNRFGEESNSSVPIKPISIPDLRVPLRVARSESFSLFLKKHQQAADALILLFMGMRTPEDLLSLAAYCRDRLNLQLFVYSLSVAILHRHDTRHLEVPRLNEIFPSLFLENGIFSRAREEAAVVAAGDRTPIEIPLNFTGSNSNPEQRVAFFREDIGINLHHWHWHLIYPFSGPPAIVNKDRRGELFYYMHHQVMARYNTERLANRLGLTRPLDNLREAVPEAYFPKLDRSVAGRTWPSRPENIRLSDVNRTSDDTTVSIQTIETWKTRITAAIRAGSMRNAQGRTIPLDATTGIDILGNAVESNTLSVNQGFYGSLHNSGHVIISYMHDPRGLYLESFAVMATTSTSMRDPIFYRWHGYIDNLFYSFIDTLPAYTSEELTFNGITITNVGVTTSGANPNTLNTHWNRSDINLANGLDFVPRGAVPARIQHLNHDEYNYQIMVTSTREVEATVRIFVAPRFYENGTTRIPFNEQRKLMIEMDKFTTRLQRGQNGILRKSVDSHVTIPFETTFRNSNQTLDSVELLYCGCGWPQHMLVPRGTEAGFPMDLFIMLTDYNEDKIEQPDPTGCGAGITYCGLRDLKYPDKRAMGFPFDRRAGQNVQTLENFLTPNMRVQPITVRFSNQVKARVPTTRTSDEPTTTTPATTPAPAPAATPAPAPADRPAARPAPRPAPRPAARPAAPNNRRAPSTSSNNV